MGNARPQPQDPLDVASVAEALIALVWDSTEAVSVFRLADGRCLDANQGAADLFGVPRGQLLGRTSLELGLWPGPAERAWFVRSLQECGLIDGLPLAFTHAS